MNFIDKINNMSRQVIDSAIIVNAKGERVGTVTVRYTSATYGWNNETGVMFFSGLDSNLPELNYGTTIKGSTYDRSPLFELLSSVGAKVYGFQGVRFYSYKHKQGSKSKNNQDVNSMSNCHEFQSFTINRKHYKIYWV